jgi:hypothetical protein
MPRPSKPPWLNDSNKHADQRLALANSAMNFRVSKKWDISWATISWFMELVYGTPQTKNQSISRSITSQYNIEKVDKLPSPEQDLLGLLRVVRQHSHRGLLPRYSPPEFFVSCVPHIDLTRQTLLSYSEIRIWCRPYVIHRVSRNVFYFHKSGLIVRFEVLTAVKMSGLLGCNAVWTEDGGSMFFRNFGFPYKSTRC